MATEARRFLPSGILVSQQLSPQKPFHQKLGQSLLAASSPVVFSAVFSASAGFVVRAFVLLGVSTHPGAIRHQLLEGSSLSCHTGLLLSSKTSHRTLPNHTKQESQVGSEVIGIYCRDRVPAVVLPVSPFLLGWHKTAPAVNTW